MKSTNIPFSYKELRRLRVDLFALEIFYRLRHCKISAKQIEIVRKDIKNLMNEINIKSQENSDE